MATTTTVSSNYAGKVAGAIIGASFKEGDTLSKNVLTLAPNVNYIFNLRKIAYTDGTVDYSCGHVPAGAIVLSEKVIEPKKVKNDFDVCKEDFRQTWSEDSMGASASNPNAPADIMEAIQLEMLSSQAELIDAQIWSGLNATNGQIGDGFIPQFTADGDVVKANNGIVPPATATTEANVEAHLKLALSAIPTKVRRKNLNVMVSSNVWQAYMFYLTSKGIAWNGSTEEKRMGFAGYMLVEIQGLPDNTIVCAESSNLVFATGLEADFNDVSLVDEDTIGLLTGQVRGKIVYSGGMGYYNPSEIVYLLTTTA